MLVASPTVSVPAPKNTSAVALPLLNEPIVSLKLFTSSRPLELIVTSEVVGNLFVAEDKGNIGTGSTDPVTDNKITGDRGTARDTHL